MDLDKNLSADIYQYSQQICGSRILYCIFILPLSSSQASTEVLAPHEGCAARDDPETELALSYVDDDPIYLARYRASASLSVGSLGAHAVLHPYSCIP